MLLKCYMNVTLHQFPSLMSHMFLQNSTCVPSQFSRYTQGECGVCCACAQCLLQLVPPTIILPIMYRVTTVPTNTDLAFLAAPPPHPPVFR
jgi:hypothetical protein